jgi:hypothetical protein
MMVSTCKHNLQVRLPMNAVQVIAALFLSLWARTEVRVRQLVAGILSE